MLRLGAKFHSHESLLISAWKSPKRPWSSIEWKPFLITFIPGGKGLRQQINLAGNVQPVLGKTARYGLRVADWFFKMRVVLKRRMLFNGHFSSCSVNYFFPVSYDWQSFSLSYSNCNCYESAMKQPFIAMELNALAWSKRSLRIAR